MVRQLNNFAWLLLLIINSAYWLLIQFLVPAISNGKSRVWNILSINWSFCMTHWMKLQLPLQSMYSSTITYDIRNVSLNQTFLLDELRPSVSFSIDVNFGLQRIWIHNYSVYGIRNISRDNVLLSCIVGR